MPRRRNSKRLLKAEERFTAAVTSYIVGLGARPSTFYHYVLDTPAGLLRITVYETWVATRFDDVERAKVITRACGNDCNPFSGKWNFHFGDGTATSLDPDAVLSHLDYYFDRLMHWESVA